MEGATELVVNQQQQPAPAAHNPKPKQGISKPLFIVSLAVMAAVGYLVGSNSAQLLSYVTGVKVANDSVDLSSVEETYKLLKANYDGTLDTQALIDGASRGLVAAAGDKFTVFMDAKETQAFKDDLSGQVTGIGAAIGTRSSETTLVRIIPNSPAEQAGLKAGDILVAVNGEAVKGMPVDQVVDKIRGQSGTSVKITITRGQDTKDYTITRAQVSDPSVRAEVRDNVGILTITRFDTDTADLARKAALDFKQQNVKAVILDLRDNGGGYATAGRDVAGLWLANQTIFTERQGSTIVDTERSTGDAPLAGVKTIVLVNGGTASASEIVSGALHEAGAATLLGEKTYGKGSVQQVIDLAGGRTLKVTVAKWYTPKGNNINGTGFTPDKVVPMTTDDVNAGRDPQLDAAIAAVNS